MSEQTVSAARGRVLLMQVGFLVLILECLLGVVVAIAIADQSLALGIPAILLVLVALAASIALAAGRREAWIKWCAIAGALILALPAMGVVWALLWVVFLDGGN